MPNRENYFRNRYDHTSIEGVIVDADSLWLLDENQNLLVLVDEDQFASTMVDLTFFVPV